jgi:DNA-binding MarR family transcriptional regulator
VATRDIERVLEQGGDAPVYGPNLRASCRRMEAAGWLRTLRAPNLQLAVELTDAGRALAAPLLADEQARASCGASGGGPGSAPGQDEGGL